MRKKIKENNLNSEFFIVKETSNKELIVSAKKANHQLSFFQKNGTAKFTTIIKNRKKMTWPQRQSLWIGDPSYVFNNEEWQSIVLKMSSKKYADGLLNIYSTGGDGCFGSLSCERCYDIDSGTIAIVPLSMIDIGNPKVKNNKYVNEHGSEVWIMEEIISTEIVRIHNELHFRVNNQTVEIVLLERLNHIIN